MIRCFKGWLRWAKNVDFAINHSINEIPALKLPEQRKTTAGTTAGLGGLFPFGKSSVIHLVLGTGS